MPRPSHPVDDRNTLFTLTASDLMARPQPVRWLIQDFLEQMTLALLFGDPGVGKSLLALDWAACVAAGKDWHGHSVEPGPVLYIAGEGRLGLARRMQAWALRQLHGSGSRDSRREFQDLPLVFSGRGVSLPGETPLVAQALDELARRYDAPPRLIIIDTLARTIEGDENSASDMGAFLRACDHLRSRYGSTVLIVHHSGHREKNRARAHSSLTCTVDVAYCFQVSDENSGIRELTCTKAKDFEAPAARYFAVRQTRLPAAWNTAGVSTTAPVLVECH